MERDQDLGRIYPSHVYAVLVVSAIVATGTVAAYEGAKWVIGQKNKPIPDEQVEVALDQALFDHISSEEADEKYLAMYQRRVMIEPIDVVEGGSGLLGLATREVATVAGDDCLNDTPYQIDIESSVFVSRGHQISPGVYGPNRTGKIVYEGQADYVQIEDTLTITPRDSSEPAISFADGDGYLIPADIVTQEVLERQDCPTYVE